MTVMADVCLCEYTDHGHCGVIVDRDGVKDVDNDQTLPLLMKQAVSFAAAGADFVAPSDMMDGRVGAIRRALDERALLRGRDHGLLGEVRVRLLRSVPRGRGVGAAVRRPPHATRWIPPTRARRCARSRSTSTKARTSSWSSRRSRTSTSSARRATSFPLPIAAYNVSGEYSMVKAAAERGWIDGPRVMNEILTSIKRAGADLIITYHALEFAEGYRG